MKTFPQTLRFQRFLLVLTFAASLTFAGPNAFATERSIPDGDGVRFNRDGTELPRFPPDKKDANYVVPSSVKKIADAAFSGLRFVENRNASGRRRMGRRIRVFQQRRVRSVRSRSGQPELSRGRRRSF